MRDLWECPACGRRFANTNQTHSCGNPELEEILADRAPGPVATFWAVVAALEAVGEFRIHPQKTRIAFISRMTFASCRLARAWVDLGLILPAPVDSARISALEMYGPTSFGHTIRLHSAAEVDEEVGGWLSQAVRRGDQETLDPEVGVAAVRGRPLELLRVGLRAAVARRDDRLVLRIPRFAGEAFAATPRVDARIGSLHWPGVIETTPSGYVLIVDDSAIRGLGLGEGDHGDVFLRADRR
jgi:hypothetical protein